MDDRGTDQDADYDQDEDGDEGYYEPNSGDLASVIRIGRNEDVAAVCGRVDTAPTFAVVIHAPEGNRALSTELGIRRLQRHVEESGKLIAIASTSVSLSSRARQAGIPVARRPDHVRWDAGGKHVLRLFGHSLRLPSVGRYVQYLVIIGFLAVMAGLVLTMAPSANVTVYPPTDTLERLITINASPDIDAVDLTTLTVPSSEVSASSTITLAVKTTGKASVGVTPATAQLSVTNSGAAQVSVPAGVAAVAGESTEFFTDTAADVPPGKTVTIPATAALPGVAGNVAAGAIKVFRDEPYKALRVTNPAAATGGANAERAAVTEADIVTIKNLAKEVEKSESVKATLIQSRPHDAVFIRTASTTVAPGTPSAETGVQADLLLMDVTITVKAQAILSTTLDEVARAVLSDGQGEGEFIPGSVTAVETGARQSDSGENTVRTELRVRGEFARNVSAKAVTDAIKGKSSTAAKSTLLSRYGIQDVEIDLSPSWAPRLPRFDFRLDVEIRTRPAEDTSPQEDNGATPVASPTAAARN
ncbi:hypothetical protein AYO38_06940 [bacterium SCGC AG-212-C10]|nr:hypothetical protein AYO38_06940 [bacterium SCGC AG-212-C10]